MPNEVFHYQGNNSFIISRLINFGGISLLGYFENLVVFVRGWWISARNAGCFTGAVLSKLPSSAFAPYRRMQYLAVLFGEIGEAHLRQPIAQCVAGKAQCPRRLALVAVCPPQGFADDFLFPLIERDALGQERHWSP